MEQSPFIILLFIERVLIVRYTLLWSFLLGAFLAFIIFHNTKKPPEIRRETFEDKYDKWFKDKGLQRKYIPMDTLRYGNYDKELTESNYLHNHISVLCVLLVRKRKNAIAANNTWVNHCNDRMFIYLKPERVQKTMLPIRQEKIQSSWQLLCDAIRKIPANIQWTVFVYDDMFVIPENVRLLVAGLQPNEGHYLGHAITFWGTTYNVGQAGYVLSRGSISALKSFFNSSESCIRGGRFWKQEDFYLGKHLSTLGINPVDTRDSFGLSTFHGYNVAQLLFPGSLPQLANYYKHSIFPVRCCSQYSVTFQSVEGDKMFTNYYMVYDVQLFASGEKGKVPAHKPKPDSEIWKGFLREQGVTDMNISAEAYYELWKSIVNDPVIFGQNIKNSMNISAIN